MKRSTGNLDRPDSKAASYKLSKEIVKQFEEKNQSVVCRTLKGADTGKALLPCSECIRDAARLAEAVLFEAEGE